MSVIVNLYFYVYLYIATSSIDLVEKIWQHFNLANLNA